MTSIDPNGLASITSVLASAASQLDVVTSVLATATNEVTTKSLLNVGQNLQATLSYYSLLEVAATATNTVVASSASNAAVAASSYAKELYDDHAFYRGNAPSFGGNIALCVVMAIFLVYHLVMGVYFKQWWFFVCYLCGLILEVVGYAGRIVSAHNVESFNGFVMQFVCITLGPCFFLAGIYYIIGELTVIFGQPYSIFKPMQYSIIFISCDLIAIILQGAGGGISSAALNQFKSTDRGSNIMLGGLAFQVAAMTFFQFCWYYFFYKVHKEYKANGDKNFTLRYKEVRQKKMFKWYPVGVSIGLLFIFIRSIYRVAELSHGFQGKLANEETTFMILESLMMCIALVFMSVFHPGLVYKKGVKIVTRGKERHAIHQEEMEMRGAIESQKNEDDMVNDNEDDNDSDDDNDNDDDNVNESENVMENKYEENSANEELENENERR